MIDIIQKIKVDTATQVFNLLVAGHHQDHILRFMADPIHASVYANVFATGNGATQNGSMPNTPTPTQHNATPRQTQGERIPGLYSIMHDRFNRGDLGNPQTQNAAHSYQTPYSDTFHHTGGNGHHAGGNSQVPDDNINVGVASALQEFARSANTAAGATTADASGSIVTTAGGNMLDPANQAQNFGDHLANTLATTVADYNPGTQTMASAAPNQGYAPADGTTPESMLPFRAQAVPQQIPEESITVGTSQPQDPPLKLNKDGKPSKRQPPRKTKSKSAILT